MDRDLRVPLGASFSFHALGIKKQCSQSMRGHIYAHRHVLCHEYVIHAKDVNLVDALRLELVVLFDVPRCLRMARGGESSRHADLFQCIGGKNGKVRKRWSAFCAHTL